MLQNVMSTKPATLINGMSRAADPQATAARPGVDVPSAREVAQKKAATPDTAAAADTDKQPQAFEQILSNATTAQKPEAKAAVTKSKAAPADPADPSKAEPAATPDIALLMSLLPALPQADVASAATGPATTLPVQDDAGTIGAIASATTGRATPTTAAPVSLALPQVPTTDAVGASGNAVVAAVVANATSDAIPGGESRLNDKLDLFASVLANLETPAPTSTPMLAVPSHQAPTLTAVAQALPVTAPGSLDELPISHEAWPAAMSHRVLWAIGEGIQKVELSVSPQDMGPINVHIRVENDKADIRFTAAHAQTRDVIESSIPKLRDMFSQQGLNLSQAQVFSQNSHDTRGRQPDANDNPASPNTRNGDTGEAQELELARPMTIRRGLVDDYA